MMLLNALVVSRAVPRRQPPFQPRSMDQALVSYHVQAASDAGDSELQEAIGKSVGKAIGSDRKGA